MLLGFLLTFAPVISSTAAMFANIKVLWVVKRTKKSVLNRVYHTWLQVNQQCSRDIVVIISLVEKYVLAVLTLACVFFECSVSTDAVLHAKLFPKLIADCKKLGLGFTHFGCRIVLLIV